MRYGFKAAAERTASEFREWHGVGSTEPLDAKGFLQARGIIVWQPHEVPGLPASALKQLVVVDPDAWSGLTLREGHLTAVIVNTAHPLGRQSNTLMHEWAHIHLKHSPKRVDVTPDGVLLISDYEKGDEDEADWLAAAMLVPRDGLLALLRRGMNIEDLADTFCVSKELVQWRIRMTGVGKQIRVRV